jgi:GT2 family glycosyltransferase
MPQSFSDIPRVKDSQAGALHVVTVNYDSPREVAELIQSFSEVSHVTKFWVMDHSGIETLVPTAAPFPIEVVKQHNRGYAAGLNTGIRRVEDPAALVLMCNPDVTIVNPDGIERAMRVFDQDERLGLLLPPLEFPDSTPILSCQRFYSLRTLLFALLARLAIPVPQFVESRLYPTDSVTEPREVDWGSGAVMMARKSFLEDIQGLDERFFLYFEDVDLCARTWKAGRKVMFFPPCAFRHQLRGLSRQNALYSAIHVRSLMKFLWKYRGFIKRSDLFQRATMPPLVPHGRIDTLTVRRRGAPAR